MTVPDSPGAQPEHVAVYLRMRALFGDPGKRSPDARKRAKNKKEGASVPFGAGRDPRGIEDILDGLTSKLGWNSSLAKADLLASWSELAGAETASHSEPVGIDEGVLTVHCDSTAWATQLRLMRGQITTSIAQRFPDAGIQSVKFDGPNAPSWKRGTRSIPGRGPRDTYG
ncbi:MAG TPA: DciA family protein [Galbitalea sp.]|jgi:predicted nucleic acid-binding Zn ribbon protein|nr:DciA family protein [Galbitalea sp.]